jgi:hypothetical protein
MGATTISMTALRLTTLSINSKQHRQAQHRKQTLSVTTRGVMTLSIRETASVIFSWQHVNTQCDDMLANIPTLSINDTQHQKYLTSLTLSVTTLSPTTVSIALTRTKTFSIIPVSFKWCYGKL